MSNSSNCKYSSIGNALLDVAVKALEAVAENAKEGMDEKQEIVAATKIMHNNFLVFIIHTSQNTNQYLENIVKYRHNYALNLCFANSCIDPHFFPNPSQINPPL